MPTPVLTPTASHPTLGLSLKAKLPRTVSCSSISSLGSNSSLLLLPEGDVEEVTEEGVYHADIKLEARKYKTPAFCQVLLELLQTIRVPTWGSPALDPELIKISKISGAFTNAVFFISYSGHVSGSSHSSTSLLTPQSTSSTVTPRTVLLRIYGPSSSTMISRTDELHTLHILSSVYRIGPRVYGTFQNGRVEEWFDSSTLSVKDLRDPTLSRWIGIRMRELHSVDILRVVGSSWNGQETVAKNAVSWLGAAQEGLDMLKANEDKGQVPLGHIWYGAREKLDLSAFRRAWEAYWTWLQKWENEFGKSEMVFAHNDTQYGNLLRNNKLPPGKPDHHKIIVVDFEFAGPNPAAFDIANHFNEWMADYGSPETAHVLTSSRYPTREERWNFYLGYLGTPALGGSVTSSPVQPKLSLLRTESSSSVSSLTASSTSFNGSNTPKSIASSSSSLFPVGLSQVELEEAINVLEDQVQAWSPASHAMWTIWGIVQANDDITNGTVGDFDYIGYAVGRLERFYQDLNDRGIKW